MEVINARETVPSSPIPALLDQCEQAQPLGIGETLEGHLPHLRPTPPGHWVRTSYPEGTVHLLDQLRHPGTGGRQLGMGAPVEVLTPRLGLFSWGRAL